MTVIDEMDRQASKAYAELAARMAEGHEPTPEEISAILKDAGRSRSDLRADVTRLKVRYAECKALRESCEAERHRIAADCELAELNADLKKFIEETNRAIFERREAVRAKQNEVRRFSEESTHAANARASLLRTASAAVRGRLDELRRERTDLLEKARQLGLRLGGKSYNPAVPGGAWSHHKTEGELTAREAALTESIGYQKDTGADAAGLEHELSDVRRGLAEYKRLHDQADALTKQISSIESEIARLESQLWNWKCADLIGAADDEQRSRHRSERERWRDEYGEGRLIEVAM